MIDPGSETGDQLQPFARRREHIGVDPVGDGRHQHVAVGHRGLEVIGAIGLVMSRQGHIEQLRHPGLDRRHQLAGDDDAGALWALLGIGHDAARARQRLPVKRDTAGPGIKLGAMLRRGCNNPALLA
jgi:hypothetical protein